MFDQEAKGEERMHKVVTKIESVQFGTPYRWRAGTDAQRLGQAKTVYPVRVSFTTCDDGQFDWRIADYQKYNHSCRVDETANGEWSCTTYGLGTTKSTIIPKQAGNDVNTGGGQSHRRRIAAKLNGHWRVLKETVFRILPALTSVSNEKLISHSLHLLMVKP